MKDSVIRNTENILVLSLAALYLLWFAWPLVWTVSENHRLVSSYDMDEADHLMVVAEALRGRTFDLGRITYYGHLQFNLALLVLHLAGLFTPVSEQTVMVSLRLLEVASSIAVLAVTFLLARRLFGRLTALVTLTLLAVNPLFLTYSVKSSPDVMQLLLMLLGVYFTCLAIEKGSWRWLLLASVSTGLAHATKYAGIFLLPVVLAAGIAQALARDGSTPAGVDAPRLARTLRLSSAAAGVLLIAVGLAATPDFAERHLASDGRIDNASEMQLLDAGRVAALFVGAVLAVLSVPQSVWSAVGGMPELADALKKAILMSAAFFAAFFMASPFSVLNLGFIKIIHSRYTNYLATGYPFAEGGGVLAWLRVLHSPGVLDWLMLLLSAAGVVLIARKAYGTLRTRRLTPEMPVLAWTMLYAAVLLLFNYRPPHYILPVLPFAVMFSAEAVGRVIGLAGRRLPEKSAVLFAAAVLAVLAVAEIPRPLDEVAGFRQFRMGFEAANGTVRGGRWLAENYPPSTRILYDAYSYVPPSFKDVNYTWEGTLILLESFNPDVVVTNSLVSGRFSGAGNAKNYYRGEKSFNESYEYYASLRDGTADYALKRDFGDVRIYEKKHA